MAQKISADKLAREIQKQLSGYTEEVIESTRQIALEVSKKAVEKLKTESPKKTGEYRRGWTYTADGKGVTVHQKGKNASLTHLLEKGHQLRRGGRSIGIGFVEAREHIAVVEEECVKEYVEKVEKVVGK